MQIKNYPEYSVTKEWKVFSHRYRKTRELKIIYDKKWYWRVFLWKNKKWKPFLVHRLVAETFLKNPTNKPQVNHKNWNTRDNRLSNLEWVTNSENWLHSFRELWRKISDKNKRIIVKNNKKRARIVLQFSLDGKLLKEFSSIWDIWLIPSCVWKAIKENRPYKGFYFQYKKTTNP